MKKKHDRIEKAYNKFVENHGETSENLKETYEGRISNLKVKL